MRVIGAGLGRTGTYSLKLGLEKLLGGTCYHMAEVFPRLETDVPFWHAAARNELVDWRGFLGGYVAAVDWPIASFWPEATEAFPDALVVLSVRDFDSWWSSTQSTIFNFDSARNTAPHMQPWIAMLEEMMRNRFTSELNDEGAVRTAFDRHYDDVRKSVPSHRLLEWQAHEGWEPLCEALKMPVPDEPFPKANTREEFIGRRLAEEAAKHHGAEVL